MENKVAWSWHPDNLIPGKIYRFRWRSYAGKIRRTTAQFVDMRLEYGTLMLVFQSLEYDQENLIDVQQILSIGEKTYDDNK
jgi:hypothetical protein